MPLSSKIRLKIDYVRYNVSVIKRTGCSTGSRADLAWDKHIPYFRPVVYFTNESCSIDARSISDMEETKRLLVENSHLPMSIILVGVGRGDMSKMDILDDDNRTMSWNGRRSERDIVQFVEMSKYLPDQCLDPFTFHSVMDAANAKYHLARVRIGYEHG